MTLTGIFSWLIWNHERGMWWKAGSNGYTDSRELAGRYTFAEATQIVDQANRFAPPTRPEEALVPDFDKP